ncbi:hypothetical protein DM01DRAFT_1349181 [Hesseltinella vesiculosa]|uniref:Uncharacterized protein n=1 Tax=Hesseltinella vesiculosa TaxID=101127 RepID=A0A1X2G696_9FUNG|nr:hypothetical protein DM01DRAFT_1349181 [Hesseltinella vesiculosa]
MPGHTQELTMACKLQASCNRNHVTENFESRIKQYVKFRYAVQDLLPPSRVLAAIKDHVYECFALETRIQTPVPDTIPFMYRNQMVVISNELWAMKPIDLPTISQETLRANPV